jgi:cell division protein FtsN
MVMDYSEKRPGTKDSVVERKPVQKNRPRKEPVGMFPLLAVAALVVTFGAGVLTGWLLFKGTKKAPAPVAVAQPVKKDEVPPAATQPTPKDAPLTFYKTLPAGGKGAIGSGLNLKKPEHPAAQPAASVAPAAGQPTQPSQAGQEAAARYTVQVASYRDKPEAEAAQAKLAAKGVAAYLVESNLQDKGLWYRLRVGKHLSKEEAGELAAKAGKGAIVLAE